MFVDDGAVPKSIEGLRGVQHALDLLEKRKLVTIGDGEVTLKLKIGEDLPTGVELETRLFPNEFFTPCDHDEDNNDDNDDEALSDEYGDEANDNEDELDKNDGDGAEIHDDTCNHEHHKKRKRPKVEHVTTVSTPTKSWKSKDKSTKKKTKSEAAGGDQDEDAMFQALFGNESQQRPKKKRNKKRDKSDMDEKAEDQSEISPALQKRRRKDMAKALFGDFEDDEGNNSGDDAEAPSPAESTTPTKMPQTGLWTFEVTGKKLGIRAAPDVDKSSSKGHLGTGEIFKVTEQVPGKDGRTYLRLADGRGWAYDRSAKDIDKIVVRELVVKLPGEE